MTFAFATERYQGGSRPTSVASVGTASPLLVGALPWAEDLDEILREALSPEEAYRRKTEAILKDGLQYDDAAAKALHSTLDNVKKQLVSDLLDITNSSTEFGATHMRSLQDAVDRASVTLEQRLSSSLSDTLKTRWNQGVQDTDSLIPSTSLPTLGISVDQLAIAQQVASDLVRKVSSEFRNSAKTAISMGILGKKSAFGIMQDVAGLLRTQPDRQGNLGTIAYQAERIVRTESNAIYSLASQVRQQQVADDTTGMRKYWVTAHDVRVRPDHTSAGQRYAPGGDPGPIPFGQDYMVGGEHMKMPHDPRSSAKQRINCRCISVMYHADWFGPPAMPEPDPFQKFETQESGAVVLSDATKAWREGLTKPEITALRQYAGNLDSYWMNMALRGDFHMMEKNVGTIMQPIMVPNEEQITRHLTQAAQVAQVVETASLPLGVEVYRGIRSLPHYLDDMKALVGQTFVDPAFVSTTLTYKQADAYARDGGVVVTIRVPQGAKAIYADSSDTPRLTARRKLSEKELFLQRGSSFRVISVQGNHVTLEMEVQPPSPSEAIDIRFPDKELVSLAKAAETKPSKPVWQPSMSLSNARKWAADSAYKTVTAHITSPVAAQAIRSAGFDLSKAGSVGNVFGIGVYSALNKATQDFYKEELGMPTSLRTMANVKKVLTLDFSKQAYIGNMQKDDIGALLPGGSKAFDQMVAQVKAEKQGKSWDELVQHGLDNNTEAIALGRQVQAAGYDALLIKDKPSITQHVGGDQLLVYDPKQVVVIR